MEFIFTNLKFLHNDMRKMHETRATFPFEYNQKSFSCIFLTDIVPYRLYLTTLGANPLIFEFEVYAGYKTNCYIDSYSELINYLEIEYDKNYRFRPADFFEALNQKIPNTFTCKPMYRDVLRIASKKRIIDEEDKLFFCGWRMNPKGAKVCGKNLEKTRIAFGDKKAEMSKDKNISSCWTDSDDKERLKRLNDIVTM